MHNLNHLLLHGFYPGVHANRLNAYKAYRNYYETYIERDVRQISNIQNLFNAGLDSNFYFYRDNQGNEIDIIQEQGHILHLFEIKSSMTFHSSFLKGLNYLARLVPERVQGSNVIYAGREEFSAQNHRIINFLNLENRI